MDKARCQNHTQEGHMWIIFFISKHFFSIIFPFGFAYSPNGPSWHQVTVIRLPWVLPVPHPSTPSSALDSENRSQWASNLLHVSDKDALQQWTLFWFGAVTNVPHTLAVRLLFYFFRIWSERKQSENISSCGSSFRKCLLNEGLNLGRFMQL